MPRRLHEEASTLTTQPRASAAKRLPGPFAVARSFGVLVPVLALSACTGPQSTFDPAGTESAGVLALFWVMLGGGALIWLFVVGFSVFVTVTRPGAYSERAGVHLIVWGGCVFPTVVLSALLWYGLALMPAMRAPAEGPRVAVSGERFWWRVNYGVEGTPGVAKSLPAGGVESANELWLPVHRRTEILLGSPDVIHSFWVPAIAGKTDTIPGRVNRLVLEPTREGVFNGVCAEFCGEAHAQMGFRVVVVSQAAFDARIAAEAAPAAVTSGPGLDAFMANGCAGCHAVRGTEAKGRVGPDLTHVAARATLGAGLLPTSRENLALFIHSTDHVKPGVEMPAFAALPKAEIDAMADWLGTLR